MYFYIITEDPWAPKKFKINFLAGFIVRFGNKKIMFFGPVRPRGTDDLF